MGKRGPKPTPTSILKVRGSWLADLREGEPEVTGIPEPPAWIDGIALEAWNAMAFKLHRMGLIGDVDQHSLAIYCEAWEEFCEARDYIKKNNCRTCVSDNGGEYQHPMIGIKNKAAERLNRIGSQFGWTPSARVGLKPEQNTSKDNGKSRFFKT